MFWVLVTLIGNKVINVKDDWIMASWRIGFLKKMTRRSLTLMVVSDHASPPVLEQIVLPVNMKPSSTATPLDSA